MGDRPSIRTIRDLKTDEKARNANKQKRETGGKEWEGWKYRLQCVGFKEAEPQSASRGGAMPAKTSGKMNQLLAQKMHFREHKYAVRTMLCVTSTQFNGI